MTELPHGTVTFVFTDIEGSTPLAKRLRDGYGEVLDQHRLLLRSAFEPHGGHEIDTQGDSFFFAFARARDAVAAVVEAQRALAGHRWPEGAAVRVRVGLHTGEPAAGEQRYVGFGVHRAARISAAGHGGQMLLSNATRELVEDDLPGDVRIRELGVYRLKDVDRPERLFQLEAEGLPADFPPLRAPKLAEPHPLRRRGLLAGALIGVAAAAVAVPIFAFGQGGGTTHNLPGVDLNSVGVIDPKTNRIVAQVPVGATPTRLTVAGSSVWVVNSQDQTASRIDALRRVVTRTIPLPGPPSGIAADDSSAWVVYLRSLTAGQDVVGSAGAALIDPRFDDVTRTVVLDREFEYEDAIALGAGSVWAADPGFVTRLDPNTGKVLAVIPVGYSFSEGIVVGAGAVWAIGGSGIVRIDPATNAVVATIPVAQAVTGGGPNPTALAAGDGALWVANRFVATPGGGFVSSRKRGTVSRIDPTTNAVVATIPVGHDPFAIAADRGAVWVANRTDFSISRIDPRTNAVTATVRVGNRPEGIATGGGAVWVSVG